MIDDDLEGKTIRCPTFKTRGEDSPDWSDDTASGGGTADER
jgi:hypothetical protein